MNVFDVDPVNGLAAPDGRIFLTRGFLQKYRQGMVTDAEMASVIAHELGHVSLGHMRRRMIDFTGHNAVFFLLTAFPVPFSADRWGLDRQSDLNRLDGPIVPPG